MLHLSYLLLIFFLLGLPKVYSQSFPRDANLRESCRKQVAGKYLNLYDQKKKTDAYLNLLRIKKKQLEKGRQEAQKKLAIVKKDIASSGYDIDLSDKNDSIASQISMINENLKENKRLNSDAVDKQQNLAKQIRQLKARMSPIFYFKTFKGKGSGYKFQIEYKEACPPYRYSCPLSREKSEKLLKIFPEGKVPLVCERYANFLNW